MRKACLLIMFASLSVGAITAQPIALDWSWRFIAGGAVAGPGAFGPGDVYYFASEDRYLYAVDQEGVMIWRTDLGRQSTGAVSIGANDAIYILMSDGEVVALNRDGRLIWRKNPTGNELFPPVVLDAGYLIVADPAGEVVALTQHGREIWRVKLDTQLTTAPIVGPSGKLILAESDGFVQSLSLDGRRIKRQFLGEEASVLATDGSQLLLGSTSGRVISFATDLLPYWRADVGSAVTGLAIDALRQIWVSTDNGSLSRVTTEGVVAWREPSIAFLAPVAANGALVADHSNRVRYVTSSDETVQELRLPSRPVQMTVGPGGLIVVSTDRWISYAFSSSIVPGGPWSGYRGSSRRTGVAPGVGGVRPTVAREPSVGLMTLESRLTSRDPVVQTQAMIQIRDRVRSGTDLAGSYFHTIELAERAAGSPYFGPLSQSGPVSAPLEARAAAIEILGAIGDLQSAAFLERLLEYERDETLRVRIMGALGRLGAPLDDALVERLSRVVSEDISGAPSDRVARGVIQLVRDLDRFHGRYISPGIADVLVRIATANYTSEIRRSALTTLRSLSGSPPL